VPFGDPIFGQTQYAELPLKTGGLNMSHNVHCEGKVEVRGVIVEGKTSCPLCKRHQELHWFKPTNWHNIGYNFNFFVQTPEP
jgi:hypothetical protein